MKAAPMKLSARLLVYNGCKYLREEIMGKRTLQRSGYTLLEAAIFLALCGVLLVLFFPLLQGKKKAKAESCRSNLKQMSLAFLQYSQDNNNKFPPIALHEKVSGELPYMGTYGWADTLKTYLHVMPPDMQFFQCPTKPFFLDANATQRGYNDYWFNSNLSALPLKEVTEPSQTFLSGDGNDGHDQTDARYHLGALPQQWLVNPQSPAYRHEGAANYLFADGHVSSFTPETTRMRNWFAIKTKTLSN